MSVTLNTLDLLLTIIIKNVKFNVTLAKHLKDTVEVHEMFRA